MRKEAYEAFFKGKKVTVMGLGLLGRSVGDTVFLAQNGAELTVTDKKTKEQLASSVASLKEYENIMYVLGEHRLEDFENKDFILKSAGVPLDSEYITHAKEKMIPVYMSASLLADIVMKQLGGVTIIAVTGTRGKSTTTHMIAHMLKSAHSRVHLGGNIRGIANLPILDKIEDGEYLILELDSWQLQGFGEAKISPHIAVFTSFLDDHMNYYKNDKELYFNDKAYIYRNQHEGDVLIASAQAAGEILAREKRLAIIVPEKQTFEMSLIGDHNQVAAGLAYEVGIQCGLDDETIREAIKTFKAVDGRLAYIGTIGGVRVFNDNNATTPDATIAALKAITATFNLKPILIIGGNDKGLQLEGLEQALKKETKEIVYLTGTGTERLSLPKTYEYENLEDCVKQAFQLASASDIILFSPAFASFSKYFSNEYEKNDEFIKVVKEYAKKAL